ncbi:MAG: transposase, partial [Chloroflexi bacterium]|nr:transposase [Chloroflexota bacterium]
VVADRAYGVPRMLDLLASLGWHWLLRVQGQTRVLVRDGAVLALRGLVPRPGATWFGRFDPPATRPPAGDGQALGATEATAPTPLVGVFKAAGWRASQVVGVWAVGADEPWLLVTSLAPTVERLREYADRWQIERLFLSWKSHGWDLEATGVRDPVRLGRLLTGLVLATHWRLAAGVVDAATQLDDLAARARRRAPTVWQLALPLDPTPATHPPADAAADGTAPADAAADGTTGAVPAPRGASRPAAAKLSLLFRGWTVCRRTAGAWQTPPVEWALPDWDAPTWSRQAQQVYDGTTL